MSNKIAGKKTKAVINVSKIDEDRLKYFKAKEGLPTTEATTKSKRKKKNPNPLSCKKKQKKTDGVKDGKVQKRRKRVKRVAKEAALGAQ